MTEHLFLAGLDTGGGGAGGMGSGTLGTSSVSAVLTGAARASAELLLVFSGALYVTVTLEDVWRAMRGSLRVMLTEETAGAAAAGATGGATGGAIGGASTAASW